VKGIFGDAFRTKDSETSCPSFPYRDFISPQTHESVTQQQQQYGVISIGCNKGDDLLRQAGMYSPSMTEEMLADHVSSFLETSERMFPSKGEKSWQLTKGTCESLSRTLLNPNKSLVARLPTTAVCVEPLGANFDVLSKISDGMSALPLLNTKLVNVAVSDYDGTAQFPVSRTGPGYEQAGLNFKGWGDNAAKEFVDVKVVKLETLLKSLDLSYVDYLSIDVEGEDATVLMGSAEVFKKGKVGFVEFEINTKGSWKKTSFRKVIELMESANYECYFSTNGEAGVLIPLTLEGGCFNDEYERKRWGNVACLLRGSRGEKEIRAFAANFLKKVETSGYGGNVKMVMD
jgi:FkbM family methyltransferase